MTYGMPQQQMAMGGQPQAGVCPVCGQPLPMPFNSAQAPNMPMPGPQEMPQQGMMPQSDPMTSALMAALMGAPQGGMG